MMTPDQVRAGRALLNWTVERLADDAGLHRNTVSNYETSKFGCDPETLKAIRAAFQRAGVVFDDGEAGSVHQRRFRVGDRVRLAERHARMGLDQQIKPSETGEVFHVEGHPPATGPTYRMSVRFSRKRELHGVFKFHFELVDPVEAVMARKRTTS